MGYWPGTRRGFYNVFGRRAERLGTIAYIRWNSVVVHLWRCSLFRNHLGTGISGGYKGPLSAACNQTGELLPEVLRVMFFASSNWLQSSLIPFKRHSALA